MFLKEENQKQQCKQYEINYYKEQPYKPINNINFHLSSHLFGAIHQQKARNMTTTQHLAEG